MNKLLLFVTGCSGAGKSTFLEAVKSEYPLHSYTVQIGKLLRAKYSPDYFQGQAAPEHTQKEATALMRAEIKKAMDAEIPYIIVDGQPRTLDQAEDILNTLYRTPQFLHLYAPENIRRSRLLHRDLKDKEALKLSLTRCEGDIPKNYEVQCYLLARTIYYKIADTSGLGYDPVRLFNRHYA